MQKRYNSKIILISPAKLHTAVRKAEDSGTPYTFVVQAMGEHKLLPEIEAKSEANKAKKKKAV